MAVEEALAGLGPPAALQAALLAGPLPSGGTKAAADVPLAPRRRRGGKGGMAHSDSAFLQGGSRAPRRRRRACLPPGYRSQPAPPSPTHDAPLPLCGRAS